MSKALGLVVTAFEFLQLYAIVLQATSTSGIQLLCTSLGLHKTDTQYVCWSLGKVYESSMSVLVRGCFV